MSRSRKTGRDRLGFPLPEMAGSVAGHDAGSAAGHDGHAPLFAALGDATRLALVGRLGAGHRRSISQLADGAVVTRQAITRHLRVLESAGFVRNVRHGRESLFELEPKPFDAMRRYLDGVSAQWDQALERLRDMVEDAPDLTTPPDSTA